MAKKSETTEKGLGRVQSVGKSLYVRVPPNIVKAAVLHHGDDIALNTDGRAVWFIKIRLERIAPKRPAQLKGKRIKGARAVVPAAKHAAEKGVSNVGN